MMNRKLSMLVTATLGISLATFPVYAQKGTSSSRPGDKSSQMHRPRRSMEQRFAKILNLTTAQQSKINPILKKQGEQLRAIHKNTKLTPDQKRAQSKKIFDSMPGKINKYLTKPQQTKLKEMMDRGKNFKGHEKGGWGHKPGTPPKKK
jgi:Spy/CpxP family protein refolding chaperone